MPFVPWVGMTEERQGFEKGAKIHFRRAADQGRSAYPAAAVAARIPIERFAGPLLLLSGRDDQYRAADAMAQNIAEKRVQSGRETVSLSYYDAGHTLGGTEGGWQTTTPYNLGIVQVGGMPQGQCRSAS